MVDKVREHDYKEEENNFFYYISVVKRDIRKKRLNFDTGGCQSYLSSLLLSLLLSLNVEGEEEVK